MTNLKQIGKKTFLPDIRDFIKPFSLINQIRKKVMLSYTNITELLKEVNSVRGFLVFAFFKEKNCLLKK